MKKRTGSKKFWTIAGLSLALLFFVGRVEANPAGCPCSPCKCGSCHCGGGGGGGSKDKGGKHHDDHHHGHDHGGSSVGVGVSVDLTGVGQRQREADPFAAGGATSSSNTSHAQEKRTARTHKEPASSGNPFDDVRLTGRVAKDETASNP